MGQSLTPIPFFVDEITLIPHSIGARDRYGKILGHQQLGRETSIREFSNGRPGSLYTVDGTDDMLYRTVDGDWMQGPEC